ncbi:MAG TPA: N-glycosylase/DNA lyase [Spirochaetota bacterium]|nr:N-glycosylase/DNA lyase [Spirochaetota bacterium]
MYHPSPEEIIRISEIRKLHAGIREEIEERLSVFRAIREHGSSMELFTELVFCLLTPQSKARQSGRAVQRLLEGDCLFCGEYDTIRERLNIVRFRNKKAAYILEAREMFCGNNGIDLRGYIEGFESVYELRRDIAMKVKGIGLKEASHFLRNIGLGGDIAILDRHILKNLARLGVIQSVPPTLTSRRYLEIESSMKEFARSTGIPMDHLDFVLWYRETEDIFK